MADNTIKFNVKVDVNGKNVLVSASASVKELKRNIEEANNSTARFRNALIQANQFTEVFKNVSGSISSLKTSMEAFIGVYNNAVQSETKLVTVMRQRMGANDETVKGINDVISAQTKLGVIGGTVQKSGAQQISTFLNEASSLKTLIPAMNDLLAQQKGINATSEDAVGVANLMGKAMQGQTSALKRVGITFTDAQAEVMKFGTESERAAMLAEIITDNVGHMNLELAKTDAGKVKQASNEFGGLMKSIGAVLSPYQSLINQFAMFGMAVSSIFQVVSAVSALAKALGVGKLAMAGFRVVQASFAGMQTLVTAAVNGTTLSLAGLKTGIRGTIASLGIIGVAYTALSTAIEYAVEKLGLFKSGSDATSNATNRLTDTQRRNSDIMGRSADELTGKYNILKDQYSALKTVHEKNAWIKKNQSAFSELGMSVNGINDAYDYFVKNSDKVVSALAAIANAKAWQEIYTKDVQAYNEEARKPGTVANGAYHRIYKTGEKIKTSDFRKMGLGKGDSYLEGNTLHLTEQGAKRATVWETERARERQRSRFTPLRNNMNQSRSEMQKAQKKAIAAQAGSGIDFNRTNSISNNDSGNGSVNHTGGTTDAILPKGSIAELNRQISELQKKRERLTDPKDIAEKDAEILKLKDDIEGLNISARQIQLKDDLKGKNLDGFGTKGLGSFAVTVPSVDSKNFKDGLASLSGTITKWGEDSKEKMEQTVQDINDLLSSMDGGMGSTVEQWQTLGKAFKQTGVNGQTAGAGLAMAGQGLQQIAGDGAAAKVGAVMAAIGQLVLGASTAIAQASELGPFGWIGFSIAAMAQLASMIATVNSFSTGGIVGGTSYHGDKVPARVNSGEMILTGTQQKRLFDIANGMALPKLPVITPDTSRVSSMVEAPVISVSIDSTVQGTALKQVIRNVEKKYSKVGKKWS